MYLYIYIICSYDSHYDAQNTAQYSIFCAGPADVYSISYAKFRHDKRPFKLFYLFVSTSTVVSSMTNDVRAMLELDDNRINIILYTVELG